MVQPGAEKREKKTGSSVKPSTTHATPSATVHGNVSPIRGHRKSSSLINEAAPGCIVSDVTLIFPCFPFGKPCASFLILGPFGSESIKKVFGTFRNIRIDVGIENYENEGWLIGN